MGIDLTTLRALALGVRTGTLDLTRTVMFGRQEIVFGEPDFRAMQTAARLPFSYQPEFRQPSFAEPLFKAFGAELIESIDASGYEGAEQIHDFNRPVPERLNGRYTAFVDSGTIEHIFDPPQAIRNIHALLSDNGTALVITCANGQCGHGFYQFSPEFFFSGFSEANGFSDTTVYLVDSERPKYWYKMP